MKMGWWIITSNSLWKEVVYYKYIHPQSVMDWIRRPAQGNTGTSIIWKAITPSMSLKKGCLAIFEMVSWCDWV